MTEPSNSELDRRFNRLENSINAGFDRLDKQIAQLVSHDVFALFREAIQQRVTAAEERGNTLAAQHDKDVKALQEDIELEQENRAKDRRALEQQRADDRRNMIKVVVTFAGSILAVVATLAGIFLPMILGS